MNLLTKRCDAAEFKMTEDGPGGFTGYASTFDSIDRGGDMVVKGAFAGSLDAFKRDGFIAVGHDWGQSGVATIKDAREDERGLWIEAEFHSTADAQAERQKLKERLERGKSVGLSIGFKIAPGGTDTDKKTKARRLTKIDLFEVSIVTVPMNAEAQAVAAKSLAQGSAETKALFEDVLAERVPSLWELWDVMTTCISRVTRLAREAERTGTEVDAQAMLDEALAEFVARVRQTALDRIAAGDEYGYYSYDISSEGPPAGLTLAAHADAALAAVDGFLARAKTVNALREKDGRQLGVAYREAVESIDERLGDARARVGEFAKGAWPEAAPPVPPPAPAEDLRAQSLRAMSMALVVGREQGATP